VSKLLIWDAKLTKSNYAEKNGLECAILFCFCLQGVLSLWIIFKR